MTFTGEVNRFNFSLQVIQDTGMPHSSWRKSHRKSSRRVDMSIRPRHPEIPMTLTGWWLKNHG
jgi:hypothetical protein